MSAHRVRVSTEAPARTWSPVTAARVRQLTLVAPAPHRTASPTTLVVMEGLVMALGCAAARLVTQVM